MRNGSGCDIVGLLRVDGVGRDGIVVSRVSVDNRSLVVDRIECRCQ